MSPSPSSSLPPWETYSYILSPTMMRMLFFIAAFAFFVLPAAAATQCFYPDGVTVEPNHTPCNKTVANSACCLAQDSCTANGICLGTTNFNYRGSCTDKTWQSNACPQTCRQDPFDQTAYAATTLIISCGAPGSISNEFCCDSPGKNCCTIAPFVLGSTGNAFSHGLDQLMLELKDANGTSQTSSSKNSSAKSSTQFGVASAIGLAIGIPLGVLVSGILGFLFWRENLRSKKKKVSRRGIIVDPDKRAYFEPGPPPKPPVEVRKSLWGSRTNAIRDTPIMPQRTVNRPADGRVHLI